MYVPREPSQFQNVWTEPFKCFLRKPSLGEFIQTEPFTIQVHSNSPELFTIRLNFNYSEYTLGQNFSLLKCILTKSAISQGNTATEHFTMMYIHSTGTLHFLSLKHIQMKLMTTHRHKDRWKRRHSVSNIPPTPQKDNLLWEVWVNNSRKKLTISSGVMNSLAKVRPGPARVCWKTKKTAYVTLWLWTMHCANTNLFLP